MMALGCVAISMPARTALDQLATSWTRSESRRDAARQRSYPTGSWGAEHAHVARPAVGELAVSRAALTIRVEHIVGPQWDRLSAAIPIREATVRYGSGTRAERLQPAP